MTNTMSSGPGKCSQILSRFHNSNLAFQLFHGHTSFNATNRVLVLDSSFNPPHMGHYTLVKRAFQHYNDPNLQVLLLLSIKNVDKDPKPASFDKRMEMICLMADSLEKESIKTSVGLTKHGKFSDKSSAIYQVLNCTFDITYLVGFDTIVRIFDPKYYKPLKPADALKDFMPRTTFFCLTRGDEAETKKQLQYSKEIAEGRYKPDIPSSWHSRVIVEENCSSVSNVSSTYLRTAVTDPTKDVTKLIPSTIYEYIKSQLPVDIFVS